MLTYGQAGSANHWADHRRTGGCAVKLPWSCADGFVRGVANFVFALTWFHIVWDHRGCKECALESPMLWNALLGEAMGPEGHGIYLLAYVAGSAGRIPQELGGRGNLGKCPSFCRRLFIAG